MNHITYKNTCFSSYIAIHIRYETDAITCTCWTIWPYGAEYVPGQRVTYTIIQVNIHCHRSAQATSCSETPFSCRLQSLCRGKRMTHTLLDAFLIRYIQSYIYKYEPDAITCTCWTIRSRLWARAKRNIHYGVERQYSAYRDLQEMNVITFEELISVVSYCVVLVW